MHDAVARAAFDGVDGRRELLVPDGVHHGLDATLLRPRFASFLHAAGRLRPFARPVP
jgi:hypothetical protein